MSSNNDRSACIFEHDGFTYVCNFKDMCFWIMHEDDDESPISYLELHRIKPNDWAYRAAFSDALFQHDNDAELVKKLEENYEQYINQFIVGRGRSDQDMDSEDAALKKNRLLKAHRPKRH